MADERRITRAGIIVEYEKGQYRRITRAGLIVEYSPAIHVYVGQVAVMVEYTLTQPSPTHYSSTAAGPLVQMG